MCRVSGRFSRSMSAPPTRSGQRRRSPSQPPCSMTLRSSANRKTASLVEGSVDAAQIIETARAGSPAPGPACPAATPATEIAATRSDGAATTSAGGLRRGCRRVEARNAASFYTLPRRSEQARPRLGSLGPLRLSDSGHLQSNRHTRSPIKPSGVHDDLSGQRAAGPMRDPQRHFVKVTRSFWARLFHCHANAKLLRTNNGLEHHFGTSR